MLVKIAWDMMQKKRNDLLGDNDTRDLMIQKLKEDWFCKFTGSSSLRAQEEEEEEEEKGNENEVQLLDREALEFSPEGSGMWDVGEDIRHLFAETFQ